MSDNRIISTCMHGFWLQHAFVWKDWLYVFGTDYYGIWMIKSFNMFDWSVPQLVFNSENDTELHYQNKSIVHNGAEFVKGVDLLGRTQFQLQKYKDGEYIPVRYGRSDYYE